MSDFEAIVVGAGVVGIAIARELSLSGLSVLLLDGAETFGTWTSSRNSEVIHAGLYYPAGSHKARFCIEGRDRLYRYCESNGIPHRQLGKLIFAAETAQIAKLEEIAGFAEAAGVSDLYWLTGAAAKAREPSLECAAALLSPQTGIVDVHAFMLTMLGEAEAHGTTFVPHSEIERIGRHGERWAIHLRGEWEASVAAPILVNSCGLSAQRLACATESLDPAHIPPLHLARGVYFGYSGSTPFSHLIYPVPEPGALGLHLTLDLAGHARFGPDIEWVDSVDYSIDERRKAAFVTAARNIWPGIDIDRLHPAYAGIRPKLSGPGEPAADFVISGPAEHGCPGLINLFGIESPGLTASMAIANYVVQLLDR
jgi:L-2-hydroxyglutarate oxidase LhgO